MTLRHLSSALAVAVLAGLLHTSVASACINDSETVRAESDFKKHYQFKSGHTEQQPSIEPSTPKDGGWLPIAVTLSGVGLLMATGTLITLHARKMRD